MDKKFLEEMLATGSVGGHEIKLQKKVIEHMQGISDKVIKDTIGNVIQVLNPDSDVKILLCGHIDEIGLIITGIQDDGYIKVNKVGGVRPLLYLGTHVDIETKDGIVLVTGCAHPGIMNIADTASARYGAIKAVVGGIHLGNADDARAGQAVDYLYSLGVRELFLCHCSGEKCAERGSRIAAGDTLFFF